MIAVASTEAEAQTLLRRVTRVQSVRWRDLPKRHVRPLAVLRATDHPSFPSHRHEFWEIVVVTRGSGQMRFGSSKLPIRVGDVFVIARDLKHAFEETRGLDVFNIVFDAEYLGTVHPLLEDWLSRDALFAVGPRWKSAEVPGECLHLGSADFARMLELVQRMEAELEKQGEEARVAVFAYFLLLLTLLRRHAQPWADGGSTVPAARVSRAFDYIEKNFAERITLDELAAACHVSRRHFFRLFEQAVGVAPMEYLKKVRLQKAAEMLLTSDANVTEVAFACGFNDSNYFSSLYHREFGVPPSQFKRQGRAG
jgi:AraC-like DNA-binding protein/mannose-6-phosphate isomerase-like protein (cupin superfamily)